MDCPWCDDSSGHLHFYLDTGIARCMRCQESGMPRKLFRALGLVLPVDYVGHTFPGAALHEKLQQVTTPNKKTSLLSPPELDLPDGTLPIAYLDKSFLLHRKPLQILENWNLELDMLRQLRWGWNQSMNSFIFPVYDNENRLVFWSARNADTKYHQSAPDSDFSKYGICGELWNPIRGSTDTIYLVEGPKDSAALLQEGFWGVYLFGHKVNVNQAQRLDALPHTKVLILDSDVTEETHKLAISYHWKVIYLTSGDPADYAGRITITLSELWEQQANDAQMLRFAALEQKLGTVQVHRRFRKRK